MTGVPAADQGCVLRATPAQRRSGLVVPGCRRDPAGSADRRAGMAAHPADGTRPPGRPSPGPRHGANESIVRAVLVMARAMDLRVVAEGVETELQRDWLSEQGCDLAQGRLFGRPQPPADHAGLIRRTTVA
ncbi:EAL domain-containing protein [Actinoplanes sp. NPDC049681]|uniref:EAL domain-containing protein n=1 Tax=Actinoplanes sp. NPDC049681 TaxID=3363905 RepID=UPI0037B297EF